MSSLGITIIQTTLHWENKEANLQMFTQKIKNISNTSIIVLPEMFSTGFSMKPEKFAEDMNGPTVVWMKNLSAEKKMIITGSIIISEGDHYYNRLIWMLPNGEYGYYNKRHLFAYADEHNHYTAGDKRLIASVNGWKINLQVCYDLRFPVWSRQQANDKPEYDVLIYVANWPERRSNAWRTLLAARAIENQCYVIGVNRVGTDGNNVYHSGDSAFINALGKTLYQKAHEEDIYTIHLDKQHLEEIRSRFPFWKDADKFLIEHE